MGYYTDKTTNPSPKKGGGWLVPIIIGIAVGLLLMLVMYPTLTGNNVVLDEEEKADTGVDSEIDTEVRERVTVDVSTQITDVVDEVSPAVVGVTNIQTRVDFWREGENSEAGTGS